MQASLSRTTIRASVSRLTGLLDLDLSTRELIYRYALVVEKVLVVPIAFSKYSGTPDSARRRIRAILSVSKQVQKEAEPIFYGQNVFVIYDVMGIDRRIQQCPEFLKKLHMIRSVELVFDNADWALRKQMMLSHLRSEYAKLKKDYPAADAQMQQMMEHQQRTLVCLRDKLTCKRVVKNIMNNEERMAHHKAEAKNMEAFVYGKTIRFIKGQLKLNYLALDFNNFVCPYERHSLALKAASWGSGCRWRRGVPKTIVTFGTEEWEDELIVKDLTKAQKEEVAYSSRELSERP